MAEKPHFCSVENVGFVSGRVLVFRLQAWEACQGFFFGVYEKTQGEKTQTRGK